MSSEQKTDGEIHERLELFDASPPHAHPYFFDPEIPNGDGSTTAFPRATSNSLVVARRIALFSAAEQFRHCVNHLNILRRGLI